MQAIKEAERTRESHELRERPMSTASGEQKRWAAVAFCSVPRRSRCLAGCDRFSPVTAAIFVLGIAVASNVRFDIGAGFTVPTQAVFVPMLFAVPVTIVPLLTVVALALGMAPRVLRGGSLA